MVSQYRTILRLTVLACASLGISQVYGATTLTATSSSVNSGKTDQFTQPAVALSVSPNMTTLGPSGSTQFTPTVSYASNKGVSSSLSPAVGTISASGVYTAPASILKPQTVTVMATSAADKTKTSFATVSLMPKVAVALATPAAHLSAGQTIQLTPKVANSSDTSVNWSLSSATGTISQSGLYTAPASITDNQTVVVTATSKVNPAASASTTVTLAAAAPILMPIEVMGTSATTRTVQVSVPSIANGSGAIHLWLYIHGLEYQTQASVKVNNSNWIALENANIVLHGLGKNYGGIGGGFSTLSIVVPLPASTVQTGDNTVSFQFNGTDGNSSGFRVVAFNFQTANGTNILPASAFTADNPAHWAPPSTSASDIAAGKALYQSGTITQPVPGGSPMTLKSHCGDCHTEDGRDLKYFNYSNSSIYIRSMFHGLNSTQANQVVSYIRSLSTPAPAKARPWNPPYQPGPGLDSQPVANWAAGAGLKAVLYSDAQMLPYVAPTKTSADFNQSGYLNIRETPIAYQLVDWNHWLPRIHPVDAYGSAFLSSAAYGDYKSLSSNLVANNASVYQAEKYKYADWSGDTTNFRGSVEPGQSDSSWSNPNTAEKIYGIQQWQMVKLWELNQTFGLEGMAQSVFGSQADSRAWYTNAVFQTSPSIGKIPPGAPGIHNGSLATFNNISFLWYYLQLILNDGNKLQECTNPVDFGYFYGFIGAQADASQPQAALFLTVLEKALQLSQNGHGPQYSCVLGWQWSVNDPSNLVNASNINNKRNIWSGMSDASRVALINAYMTQWFAAVKQFTPQQFYAGGMASPTETLNDSWYGQFAGRVAFMLPHLKYAGMSESLATEIGNWAATMWPGHNWNAFANATCSENSDGYVICSSDSLL